MCNFNPIIQGHVWLTLAQWFWKRRFVNIFSLFAIISTCKRVSQSVFGFSSQEEGLWQVWLKLHGSISRYHDFVGPMLVVMLTTNGRSLVPKKWMIWHYINIDRFTASTNNREERWNYVLKTRVYCSMFYLEIPLQAYSVKRTGWTSNINIASILESQCWMQTLKQWWQFQTLSTLDVCRNVYVEDATHY